jgi:periplasmic protein TonB
VVSNFHVMPHDLFFGDAAIPPSSRTRRRFLTMFSVAVHAIVVTAIVVIQVFAVGPLPLPHRPLVFEEIRLVHLAEIQVPAPPRRSSGSSSELGSPHVAPTVEPRSVAAESGLDHTPSRPASIGTVIGVERGTTEFGSIGSTESVPPPVAVPPPPVRLHRGIQAPKKIEDVTPVYPSAARHAQIEGVVILEAIIDAHGSVASVQVLRSVPFLDQAAIDAVRQWRYMPALLNGQAVPVIVTITLRFQLK